MFDADRIVILDTEYTSWEGCVHHGWDNDAGEYRELVELAAIEATVGEWNEVDAFDRFVRPEINPVLSDYFVDLTGIEQAVVDDAPSFESVARAFVEWSDDLPVYSYGNDIGVLERNVELHDSDVTFDAERFHDVREVFSAMDVPVDEYTSGTVCEFFDAEVERGSPHNALYDCRSILAGLAASNTYQ